MTKTACSISTDITLNINKDTIILSYNVLFNDGSKLNDSIVVKYPFCLLEPFNILIIKNYFEIFLSQLFLCNGALTLYCNSDEVLYYKSICDSLYAIRNYEEESNIQFGKILKEDLVCDKYNIKLEQKNVLNLISGGKDSLASDFLLRANDINIFRCYIDGLNIASSISEFDACKNLYDNFDVISIYGFENLIFSLEEISNCYCNPPTHNFIPRGRDLLTISLAYPVAQHYKCGYISHSCERDLWEGNIFVNGKSIPLHDSQSKLVMLPLNKQMKVSTDIHVFSPIAGMYEIYILKWIIMKYPDKFKLIQSCFYGSWCGECSKCLRYYLVEKYCGVNLLKFKNNPELQIPNLVRKLVQDNYEYGFSKELKFLLGIKEDEEDLFLPIRDSLFPEFLRKCNLK